MNLYWAFDEQGRRVDTGTAFPNCAVPGAWDISLPSRTNASSPTFPARSPLLVAGVPNQTCKPLVHVKVVLQPSGLRGLEVIESMTISVINAALAARAHAATAAHLQAVRDGKSGSRKARP